MPFGKKKAPKEKADPPAPTIVVIGGGVAGLTTAHELSVRGYKVKLYEKLDIVGGMARSTSVGEWTKPLPGEHGFRIFFNFYKGIHDTFGRIPYTGSNSRPKPEDSSGVPNINTVYDNLISTDTIRNYLNDRDFFDIPTRLPTGTDPVTYWIKFLRELITSWIGIDVPIAEQLYFAQRLLVLLGSCDKRFNEAYESKFNWWGFLNADKLSKNYQLFLAQGITRVLQALDPQEASLKTFGRAMIRIFTALLTQGYVWKLLDGPTNDKWMDPMVSLLTSLGVEFHTSSTVTSIQYDKSSKKITGIVVNGNQKVTGDIFVSCLPSNVLFKLLTPDMLKQAPSLAGINSVPQGWMNGVQLYFNQPTNITRGHEAFWDSPWRLTSVSQAQFWPGIDLTQYGPGTVKGILSIDVSEWFKEGTVTALPASKCTEAQILQEIWCQMRAAKGMDQILPPFEEKDKLLVTWNLDDAIDTHEENGRKVGDTTNSMPLFVNAVNTWKVRPEAKTGIENFFVGGDYCRTETDLATMEAANASGRLAATEVLKSLGRSDTPTIYTYDWPQDKALEILRDFDSVLYAADPNGNPLGWNFPVPTSDSLEAYPFKSWEQLESYFQKLFNVAKDVTSWKKAQSHEFKVPDDVY